MRRARRDEENASCLRKAQDGIERPEQPPIRRQVHRERVGPILFAHMAERAERPEHTGVADEDVDLDPEYAHDFSIERGAW